MSYPDQPAAAGKAKPFEPGGQHGKLHRELNIPEGEKIPKEKLEEATHSDDKEVRDDAIRARTMEGWHHKSLIDLEPVFGPQRTPR